MAVDTTDMVEAPRLSSKRALDALLVAKGDYDMTCEVLGCTQAELTRAVADSPTELTRVLRLSTTLNAMEVTHTLHKWLMAKADEMEGPDVARALQSMTGIVESLTRPQTSNGGMSLGPGSVINVAIGAMPREAGNAVKGLASMDLDKLHDIRRLLAMKEGKVVDDAEDADFKEL